MQLILIKYFEPCKIFKNRFKISQQKIAPPPLKNWFFYFNLKRGPCSFLLTICYLIFLEKAANTKRGRIFTEGWIEFLDKKIAKRVATNLNNTLIGGKKRSRWHDEIWNIKYLHRYSCNFIYWFYLLRTCFKLFYNLPSVLVKKKKKYCCVVPSPEFTGEK